jgi:hypothetical protein
MPVGVVEVDACMKLSTKYTRFHAREGQNKSILHQEPAKPRQ